MENKFRNAFIGHLELDHPKSKRKQVKKATAVITRTQQSTMIASSI